MSRPIKKGDRVVVISGEYKNEEGEVLSVDRKKQRVVIEGVNVRRKATRANAQNPQGGFVEREFPIHLSNVMLKDRLDAKRAARAGK